MKIVTIVMASLLALLSFQPGFAQVPREGMATKIAQVRKENAALMRHYTWNSRTELTKEAEVKDILIEFISYGPDGQVRRSLLNDMKAPLPRGFLRRAIAEKERKKMEDYLTGLRSLLDQYTLPTAGKILDFVSQANIPPLDASGLMHLNGSSVVLPGDSLSVSLVAATLQTSRMAATTFYKGDMVQVTATFKTLQGGPTYMDYGEVNVSAQELSLKVQNYDFHQVTIATPQITEPRPLSPPPVAPAPAPATGTSLQTVEQKLRDLKALLDQGLISQSDYDAKKADILQGL